MVVTGQLQAMAALFSWKEPSVTIEYEADLAREAVRTFRRTVSLAFFRNQTTFSLQTCPMLVVIPFTLTLLLPEYKTLYYIGCV
jgi:hypothetical protein